jgi:hypothetical protein
VESLLLELLIVDMSYYLGLKFEFWRNFKILLLDSCFSAYLFFSANYIMSSLEEPLGLQNLPKLSYNRLHSFNSSTYMPVLNRMEMGCCFLESKLVFMLLHLQHLIVFPHKQNKSINVYNCFEIYDVYMILSVRKAH